MNTTNIITARFGICNQAVTAERYQYDYGQVLQFSGIPLPAAYVVDFSNNPKGGDSTSQIGGEDGVNIPDAYFLTGRPIYVFVYLHTGEDDGETVYRVEIPVRPRPARTNATPTPVQQSVIDETIAALNAGVDRAETAADSAEQIAADLGDFETAMEAVTEAKNAAQQSASDASTSAGNAADSATAAAGSASGASTSATNAADSATAAADSATAAAGSASDASTSATNAAASEAAARAVEESIPADYSELSADVIDLNSQINGYSATITPVFKDNLNFQSGGVAFVYNNNYETYYIPIESGIDYTVIIGTDNTSERKGFRIVYSESIPANNVPGTFIEEIYSQNVSSITYQYTANASGYLTVAYWQGLVLSIQATGEKLGIKDQVVDLSQTVDGYDSRITAVEQDVEQFDAILNGVSFNYSASTTLEYAIPANTDCILDVQTRSGSVSVYTDGYTSDVYATITAVGKYYFKTLHDGNLRFYVAANSSASGKLYLKTRFDEDTGDELHTPIPLFNAIEIKTIKAFDSFNTIEGSYSFDGAATIDNYRDYATASTYAHNTPPVTIRDQSGALIYNNLRLYENAGDTSIAFWAFNKYGYYLRYVSMSALAQRNTTFLDDEYYVILNQYYGYPKAYWIVSDINVEWLNLESKTYTVGGNSADFATFTAMLTALANDTREKTVYVNPGEYDIFTEMGGADYIASISPQASSLNWRDVCHVVPPNTTIIGLGNVVLKWLPTAEQMINSETAFLFSPLNISGTCTIKNIKVQAQNCRYVVHDETSGIADYNGSKHTYINCVFTLLPGAYGSYVYGAGHNKLMEVTFDRCIFDSQNSVGIWSTHDVYAAVNERSRFSLMNCVFVSDKTDPYIAFSSSDQNGRKDEVIVCNCHIPKIRMITGGSAAKQGYDVTLIGCNTVPIEYSDLVTDRYTINQYNSIS